MTKTERLPCGGRWLRATPRKHLDTIVFVHHFGGQRSSVSRHQKLVASLGFDSVAFNLTMPDSFLEHIRSLKPDLTRGLRPLWSQELASVLDAIPGRKILYSFSFPSAAVLSLIPERPANEIAAWICDGGPFLNLPVCLWNYFTHHLPTSNLLRKAARMSLGFQVMGGLALRADLEKALASLRPDLPILSIRAWQDKLVPISAIDAVFDLPTRAQVETLTLAESGHIDGLVTYPQDYIPRLNQFLLGVSPESSSAYDVES